MWRREYRLNMILSALLAVLSLLALSAPTCLCFHHEEKAAASAPSCHEPESENSEALEGLAAESDCICIFAERPSIADKSTPGKTVKDAAALVERPIVPIGSLTDRQTFTKIERSQKIAAHPFEPEPKLPRGPPQLA